MNKLLMAVFLLLSFVLPVSAQELTVPEVFSSGREIMPDDTDSFGSGAVELLQKSLKTIYPNMKKAIQSNIGILSVALLFSILSLTGDRIKKSVSIGCTAGIAAMLFQNSSAIIVLASNSVYEICEYGRLLCQVLTTAMAAQGAITTATALYTGTILVISLLNKLVSKFVVPMVYFYLALSVANSALDEEMFKELAEALKKLFHWLLKTILIIFTTYMSMTGVVSGTTDLAALKAAKLSISTVIPVVGGIMADASESVLVSLGVIKNKIGIYGILAVLALFMGPFLKAGLQYGVLKVSGLICHIWGNKNISALLDAFSSAMGIMLGMAASACMMMLISVVCFLKGIG